MRVELTQLRSPWLAIEGDADGLRDELKREMSRRHALFGKSVTAIARREDCDDVLFLCDDCLAVVHLAYAGRESDPRWPSTELYTDWQHFLDERMEPDAADVTPS